MAERIQLQIPSSDSIHTLQGWVFMPPGQPKGYLQVVHGMTEHIGRYEGFMQTMAEEGYICFGFDNLGHGHTARDAGELGYIAPKDGWLYMAQDVFAFADAVKAAYGELPYYLLGHSMGSFIVRTAAVKYRRPDKLIIMGTGGPNPVGGIGLALVRLIKTLRGERHISALMQKLAFGAYNKRFGEDDPRNWLTKDADIRRRYAADPYCNFKFTVSAMEDLLRLNQFANSRQWFAGLDKTLPMLLVSGSEDPVGNYGEGVKAVQQLLQKAGAAPHMILYENCRHEILNDTCRQQVTEDILAFLEKSE